MGIQRAMVRYCAGIAILVLLVTASAGCGGRNARSESPVETVREQYETGIQKLRANDLKSAEQSFQRALELDKKSPYGYAGMALLELTRTNYDEALSQADRAIKNDPNLSDAYAVRGRVLTIRKKGKNWYEEAMASLTRALEIDPENHQALYFAAECCLDARKYRDARQYYYQAEEHSGQYESAVAERLILVGKIIQAGNLSEQGAAIALDDKIDRADLAELLVTELNIASRMKERRADLFGLYFNDDLSPKRRMDVPRDTGKNRSRDAIMDMLAIGIPSLNVFPDSYFYPDRLVTRARMAAVLQDVLALLKNSSILSTMYIGAATPFIDVHPDYYAFNAIMLCTRSGIMSPAEGDDQRFAPDGPVSGIDAILMIRSLEQALDTPLSVFYEQAGYPVQPANTP